MTKPVVLITCKQMQVELPHHRSRIEQLGYTVIAPDLGDRQQFESSDLLAMSSNVVGMIAGDDQLDRHFSRLPSTKDGNPLGNWDGFCRPRSS